MKEKDKLELYDQPRPDGKAGGAWEGRAVKFADSYEILEPQEAPDFRGYARVLRKRLPTVLIVFFILFSISLIATLKQKPVYPAQVLLEIQKENPDIPTIQELYELDSVSDAYLRSQYTILGSESLAENYVDQNLQARWKATQKAADWLSQQLLGVKARLEKSEEHLQNYARRNDLVFLETDKEPSRNVENERVQQVQEELTKAEAQRYEKEALYRVIQAGDYESLPGEFESKVIQDLTERLAELKREYARLSATFNADYPRVKEIQSQIEEIAAAIREQRKDAAGQITSDYLAAVRRENLVRQALQQEQKQMNQVAARAVQYNILKREVDTNKQVYDGLLQRLKEASVSASLKASNIRIVDAAEPPTKPVKQKIPLNLGVAAILGLGLGFCAAFLQERLDDTLKGTDDVERLFGLSAVGLIPAVSQPNGNYHGVSRLLEHTKALSRKENGNGRKSNAAWYRIDEEGKQNAPLVEAFRSLRTSILLSTADHPPSSLLVTSTQPGEGKTTIATNLAIALAQVGQRVLLVDADLRSPSLHRLFVVLQNFGLVSYLTGHQDWHGVVRPSASPGLDLLFCGPIPPNPSELLSSRSMGELIRSAREQYEFVILDSAPMLALADSRILATLVSGVLLVVKNAMIPREQVKQALFGIQSVGATVIGVALNRVDLHTNGYFDYHADCLPDDKESAGSFLEADSQGTLQQQR